MEGGKARRKNVLANNGRMSSGSSRIATRVQKEGAIALEVFESNLLTMKVTVLQFEVSLHSTSRIQRPDPAPGSVPALAPWISSSTGAQHLARRLDTTLYITDAKTVLNFHIWGLVVIIITSLVGVEGASRLGRRRPRRQTTDGGI